MMLRWLVSRLVRQAAEKKIYEVMSEAALIRNAGDSQPASPAAEREAAVVEEPAACEVALVFALGIESGGTVDLLKDPVTTRRGTYKEHVGVLDDRSVVVAESGVGDAAARQATAELIARHKPSWVVSTGFAGALRGELRRGHILMADQVIDPQGRQLGVGLQLDPEVVRATPGLHVGRLLTVDRIIRTPAARRKLAEQHDACACDMETMAIAEVCRREKVRFLSVRVISDGVDDLLPKEVEGLLDQQSLAGKLGAATGAIFQRPSSIKDLWQLREDALKASDRLAKFLRGVVAQLM